jgi:hypothetical protein
MKRLVLLAFCGVLVLWAPRVDADGHGNGQKGKKHQGSAPVTETSTMQVSVVFAPHEVQVIRDYYHPRYQNLPPGLQKKLQRTGQLPPGWQKRFEPFPAEVERQLVMLPQGYRRGIIDGHAVIFNQKTQVIADVAVLF